MSDSERDPIVRRAIDELRRLPDVDGDAVRRVVSAAAAARIAPPIDEPAVPARRFPRVSASILVGVAAAAAFVGFALRGAWSHSSSAVQPVATQPVATVASTPESNDIEATPLLAVASSSNDALPIPHQFVIHDSRARRVSVVGDFNRWDSKSTPMVRSANSGMWSVTIPMLPGRHMYGFIVDDSAFVLDPDRRFARTRDADLGVEGSVVIVGRP
jgi:hypothetical protein